MDSELIKTISSHIGCENDSKVIIDTALNIINEKILLKQNDESK